MTLHLIAALISTLLAPLPDGGKPATPGPVTPGPVASGPVTPDARAGLELPVVPRAPKLTWKPGTYAPASLVLPEVTPMEKFDMWQFGPNWPQVEVGVVVVTDHAGDPGRFMAFLVDVKQQRIAAIREGDKGRHLQTIGQMAGEGGKGSVPPSIMSLAGSGAVIIVRPPVPPGPAGIPKDLVARMLDTASLAAFAGEMIGKVQPI